MESVQQIITNQRQFFQNGDTLNESFRRKNLEKLRKMLQDHEKEIYQALKEDLNKSNHETYTTELGFLLVEIDVALKNLKKWMEVEKVETPMTHTGTNSYIHKDPYGVALVIAPWNYPLQLAIGPVIAAMAAGNCIVIKPSEFAQSTSTLLAVMFEATFNRSYIAVVEGAKEVSQNLLSQRFDYIFFTGSIPVGKIVMEAASKHLTPVTLELGGKSPAIIDKDADIKLAAKRIVWGKFTNAGQTCVAPDYLYVHEKVKKKLIVEMKKHIKGFYGKDPLQNEDYVRIINEDHFRRLENLLSEGAILHGGRTNDDKLIIEPTIIDELSWEDPIMKTEIFGPILPVLSFENIHDALSVIKAEEKPLALYFFGKSTKMQDEIIRTVSFGGGSINDTLYHLANPHLPFGGVGSSGMGSYHGIHGFNTFTHKKSILKQTTKFDIPLRYPGGKIAHMLVKKVMK
ncbi:MAG TPA: aldehyde dehydrogenase [Virgibacillus sp.]|nr:aldehyde dehydrogenase [Virgibacillus sp.]